MMSKKTIEGKIERTLESLDGMQRATPQPWFFTRVKARLQREERSVWESIGSFLSKPAVAMAGLGLIPILNLFVLFKQDNLHEATNVASQPVQLSDSESILASNSSFDYEKCTTMSRPGNKNLSIIIAVLLLTNIGVLAYFLWYKNPSDKQEQHDNRNSNGIADQLQKEVGFTPEQIAQYKQMKEKQRETIRPMYDEMRKAKDSLFRLLKDSIIYDSVTSKAADQIAERQKMLDMQTFTYFRKVRTICTPEQLPKYDSLIQGMFSRMNRPQRRSDSDSTKTDKKN